MKPVRNKKYLKWVKQLPSAISGRPADDAHHLVGRTYSGMGTKASDHLVFPLTRDEHAELHNMGWRSWEQKYGDQRRFALNTLHIAIDEGILRFVQP